MGWLAAMFPCGRRVHECLELTSGTMLRKAFRNGIPVDDLPNSLEIVRADVLVLKVVGMLPDIDAQQWNQTCCCLERILVSSRGDLQTLKVLVVALEVVFQSGGLKYPGVQVRSVQLGSCRCLV